MSTQSQNFHLSEKPHNSEQCVHSEAPSMAARNEHRTPYPSISISRAVAGKLALPFVWYKWTEVLIWMVAAVSAAAPRRLFM